MACGAWPLYLTPVWTRPAAAPMSMAPGTMGLGAMPVPVHGLPPHLQPPPHFQHQPYQPLSQSQFLSMYGSAGGASADPHQSGAPQYVDHSIAASLGAAAVAAASAASGVGAAAATGSKAGGDDDDDAKKGHTRKAAGKVWVDETLDEWPESAHRM